MVTATNTQQQEIEQILQIEVDCVNKLLHSLELEYTALAEHHADALEDVVRSKQENIIQLEAITRKREKLLDAYDAVTNISQQSSSNKNYRFHDNKQLSELWNKLVDIAEKCRDKNRINGSIVETASRQSKHALDILRGIVPNVSSPSEIYDNSGRKQSFTSKHTLVHV